MRTKVSFWKKKNGVYTPLLPFLKIPLSQHLIIILATTCGLPFSGDQFALLLLASLAMFATPWYLSQLKTNQTCLHKNTIVFISGAIGNCCACFVIQTWSTVDGVSYRNKIKKKHGPINLVISSFHALLSNTMGSICLHMDLDHEII